MYEYSARQIEVVDGDTVDAEIDLGFSTFVKQRLRLYGINTPETNRKESKQAGLAAKAYLKQMLQAGPCVIKTRKDKTEKYGRYLAELFVNGQNLNEKLLSEGHAVPYMQDKPSTSA